MSSLKEKVTGADEKKVDSSEVVFEVWKESEQLLVRFNVALFGCNWVGKLARTLMTELASAVVAVVQGLGYDSMSRLQKGLEIAY